MQTLIRNVLVSKERSAEAEANLWWLAEAAKRFETPTEFFLNLNRIEEQQQTQIRGKSGTLGKTAPPASLLLASITSVKGLEFDAVLIPYLAQGEFPATYADLKEESNTFYVGITRARQRLSLMASTDRPSKLIPKKLIDPN